MGSVGRASYLDTFPPPVLLAPSPPAGSWSLPTRNRGRWSCVKRHQPERSARARWPGTSGNRFQMMCPSRSCAVEHHVKGLGLATSSPKNPRVDLPERHHLLDLHAQADDLRLCSLEEDRLYILFRHRSLCDQGDPLGREPCREPLGLVPISRPRDASDGPLVRCAPPHPHQV
jgi:hypothetical protein